MSVKNGLAFGLLYPVLVLGTIGMIFGLFLGPTYLASVLISDPEIWMAFPTLILGCILACGFIGALGGALETTV